MKPWSALVFLVYNLACLALVGYGVSLIANHHGAGWIGVVVGLVALAGTRDADYSA